MRQRACKVFGVWTRVTVDGGDWLWGQGSTCNMADLLVCRVCDRIWGRKSQDSQMVLKCSFIIIANYLMYILKIDFNQKVVA
jgi:hypothetical protein